MRVKTHITLYTGGVIKNLIQIAVILCLSFSSIKAFALRADEILVLANTNASGSIGIAKYYMKERSIPEDHLVKLRITDKEWCSREEFEENIIPPVRQYLKEKDPFRKIRCIVTIYGLPLRVDPPKMSQDQTKEVKILSEKQYNLGQKIEHMPKDAVEERKKMKNKRSQMNKRILSISKKDFRSSFDSELSLVLEENYSLKGWVANPYFLGFQKRKLNIPKDKVIMVSRLDGPNVETVKRIINDSIEVEKTGLKGNAYFDARYKYSSKKKVSANVAYDNSIHRAAINLSNKNKLNVILDDNHELFQPGDCPDAALYCGWYSYRQYIDAFKWVKGSVGYHIASSECSTLKSKKSQVWCKRMIEEGVAATIGPVGEPYLQSFPVPEMFFGLLAEGHLTLVECYTLSLPFLSWQMVLIGDPLYNPFKVLRSGSYINEH